MLSSVSSLLRSKTLLATGLSTLTRSALETLSSAWWLLSAPTPDETVIRHARMIRAELGTFDKIRPAGNYLETRDGISVNPLDVRKAVTIWLDAGGLDLKDIGTSTTERTIAFFAAVLPAPTETQHALLYFSLSADSHGLSVGVGSALRIEADASPMQRVTLSADRASVGSRVNELLIAHAAVTDMLLAHYAMPEDVITEWEERKAKSRHALERVST